MGNWTWQEWLVVALTVTLLVSVLLFKFRLEIKLRRKGIMADGVIVNWMSASEAGSKYCYPLIYFVTASGKEIKFRADERCEGEPLYPIGTKVRIKYLNSQPDVREVQYPNA
jgi:hypothetical protein